MVQPPGQSPDDQQQDAESSSRQHGSTWRVLLVEDSPDDQRNLLRVLENAGANVTLECNAQAARKRIVSADFVSDCFDAIVIDLRLLVLDSIQMTRDVRKEGCTVPIIICSAEADPTAQKLALEAGCNLFLDKSLAHEEIVTHVLNCAGKDKPSGDSIQIHL
jgi:CheY-like chemotaxis protein